jgi:hypothetical protein
MWSGTGAELQNLTVAIRDLPGTKLGMASGSTIWIDRNAAGHGWFVDRTPWDDSEFAPGSSTKRVAGRVDLLSVLVHEMGHVLGLEDQHATDLFSGDVMGWALPLGVRRARWAGADVDGPALATNHTRDADELWARLAHDNDWPQR